MIGRKKNINIKILIGALALILLQSNLLAQNNQQDGKKKSSISNLLTKNKAKKNKTCTLRYQELSEQKIVFEKTFFDYGEIYVGREGIATFNFHNEGGKDLFIKDIETSCGCLDVSFDKKAIKPGQISQIKIRYNTNIVGEIKRSITVISNDVTNPRITLLLTGEVVLRR